MRTSLEWPPAGTPAAGLRVGTHMAYVQVYSTRWCGYCVRAKALLEQLGLPFEEVLLDDDPHFRATLHERTGGWTLPQILVNDRSIGGPSELWQLAKSGRLDDLLAA